MHRGDVYDADIPEVGRHPVVIVTREEAIPLLRTVVVVLVTSTVRGHRAEVGLGTAEGLDRDCVANCDNVLLLPKSRLQRYRGSLGPAALVELRNALRIALDLE